MSIIEIATLAVSVCISIALVITAVAFLLYVIHEMKEDD